MGHSVSFLSRAYGPFTKTTQWLGNESGNGQEFEKYERVEVSSAFSNHNGIKLEIGN